MVDNGEVREGRYAEVMMDGFGVVPQSSAAAEQFPCTIAGAPDLTGDPALGSASGAVLASREEGHHHAVARVKVIDLGPGLEYASAGFVSQQHRHRSRSIAIDDREVGVADPSSLDFDETFGRSWWIGRQFAYPNGTGLRIGRRCPDLLQHCALDPHAGQFSSEWPGGPPARAGRTLTNCRIASGTLVGRRVERST